MKRIYGAVLAAALVLSACTNTAPPQAISPEQAPSTALASPGAEIPLPTETPAATPAPVYTPTPVVIQITPAVLDPQATPVFSITGVEMHQITDQGGLAQMRTIGAAWTRRNALFWDQVEPNEGERRWEALAGLEQEMINAYNAGLELILIVRSTPVWAQRLPNVPCGQVLPEKLAVFGAFMHDVVARYSVPPYNVRYWELWNEPDVAPALVPGDSMFGCWGDEADPTYGGAYYAEMLRAVYPQIKAANPEAQVLVGGLALDCDPRNPPETAQGSGVQRDCSPARFLEGILQAGGASAFDGVSFHAYDFYQFELGAFSNFNWNSSWNQTGPSQIVKTRFLRDVLNSYGAADKYLINTESGLLCGRDGSEPVCQEEAFELTKAYFAAQVVTTGLAEGLRAEVWYSIAGWRGSGLLNPDQSLRASAQAFQVSTDRLRNTIFLREVTDIPGLKGYVFQRAEKQVWVMWSLDGQVHPLIFGQTPSAVVDVFGNLLENTQTLEIGLAPVYVEW